MSEDKRFDPAVVATITVTFNSDIGLLRTQLEALPRESLKLAVDNASQPETLRGIQALVSQTPNAQLLRNDENLGLAAAVNRGVRAVRDAAPTARFVLLLDQDSEPALGSVAALVAGFDALQARGERVGCVGPMLLDVATGLPHGFHQCTSWRWKRVYPASGATAPVPCANINGSGTLVPIDLFLELGGLEDSLFIDHVDTEWAFRMQAHGYQLFGIPQAVFRHRMGDASHRIWLFGWRVWPVRSPRRHYFLYRNAVVLMRRPYVPQVWKVWAVAKLVMTTCVTLATGPKRLAQMRSMASGVRAARATTVEPNA
ncbi:MAG: glycosyl transferase family 2 [Thiomonas sp. 13-66-29]|jgi:rhamnosyltransferase|nr:MAG: glycosyl transferase family 2 [Thiomonas sp. 13-66-29]